MNWKTDWNQFRFTEQVRSERYKDLDEWIRIHTEGHGTRDKWQEVDDLVEPEEEESDGRES